MFCFIIVPRKQGRKRVWAGGGGVPWVFPRHGGSGAETLRDVQVLHWPGVVSVQEPESGLR